MSRGKYSPTLYDIHTVSTKYDHNAKGDIPPSSYEVYDEEIHFANYDEQGFDSYGYSAYDAEGVYVGIGDGIDRNGITEDEYLSMDDDEYSQY